KIAIIRELLGMAPATPVYCSIARCRINAPGDDPFTYEWHQEIFHTIPESNYLQTWAPLVWNATHDIGTIQVMPRSHKAGILPQSYVHGIGKKFVTPILTIADEHLSQFEPISVEMELGQCLLFGAGLVHRSGKNSSQHVRYSLVGTYH